jgi:hypothetical protein
LRVPESPENKDFTLVANDILDDAGAGAVDAVDAGAEVGALLPVRLPNEEHPVSVAATAVTPIACRQPQHRVASREGFELPM